MSGIRVDLADGFYTAEQIKAWWLLEGIAARLPRMSDQTLIVEPLAAGGRTRRVLRCAGRPVYYCVSSQP